MSEREWLVAFGHDPVAHMNNHREQHRARGTGGKARNVRVASRAMLNARDANVGPGTWEHCLGAARARWDSARGDAIEQYRFDVHGESWGEFK